MAHSGMVAVGRAMTLLDAMDEGGEVRKDWLEEFEEADLGGVDGADGVFKGWLSLLYK